jgi:hypothetical protein
MKIREFTSDTMPFSCESNSNEIEESDSQSQKQLGQRVSAQRGIKIDLNEANKNRISPSPRQSSWKQMTLPQARSKHLAFHAVNVLPFHLNKFQTIQRFGLWITVLLMTCVRYIAM